MTEADAIAAIEAAGLKYGTTTAEYSADLPSGTVIRSDPAPGGTVKVRQGDTINLFVSNGLINIPDVAGQPIRDANATLSALMLTIKVDVDQGCSGGIVAAQSIVGEQPQRSTITIRVCP